MAELTPIPAEQRRAYYDALLAGRDEAARLGYGLLDDRIFSAFHRELYRPMLDAHEASVRAKIAEEIRAEAERRYVTDDPFALDMALAARWLTERQHARQPAESAPGAVTAPPESDPTSEGTEALTGHEEET